MTVLDGLLRACRDALVRACRDAPPSSHIDAAALQGVVEVAARLPALAVVVGAA